jgi:DNA-binding response OmpR family regulator
VTVDAANGVTAESPTPSGPILVVEDEEALVGAICYQLQREGFDAVSAVDGLRRPTRWRASRSAPTTT